MSRYAGTNNSTPENAYKKETNQHGWSEQIKDSAYQLDNPQVNQLVLNIQRFEQAGYRRNMDELQDGRTNHEY